MMPISAIIPNAIMDTVIPVLNLLERTVRQDKLMMSAIFINLSATKISYDESRNAEIGRAVNLRDQPV
jgi:hypothetical protein